LATYTETLLDGSPITTRGQLALSFLLVETHPFAYSVPTAVGSSFLIASGKLQFNGNGWSNGVGTWAGGFLTPPSSGWWQYYVDVQSILNGPPAASFSITPIALRVGNVTDPQPTAAFPTNSFAVALVQSTGQAIRTLLDQRSLPAVTFETVSGVTVSEPATNTSLRAEYVNNFAVPQAWMKPSDAGGNPLWWPIAGNCAGNRFSIISEYFGAIKFSSSGRVVAPRGDATNNRVTLAQWPLGQFINDGMGGPVGGFWRNGYQYIDMPFYGGLPTFDATIGTGAPPYTIAASTVIGIDAAATDTANQSGPHTFAFQAWKATNSPPADTFALYRADIDDAGKITALVDMRPASPGPYTI